MRSMSRQIATEVRRRRRSSLEVFEALHGLATIIATEPDQVGHEMKVRRDQHRPMTDGLVGKAGIRNRPKEHTRRRSALGWDEAEVVECRIGDFA